MFSPRTRYCLGPTRRAQVSVFSGDPPSLLPCGGLSRMRGNPWDRWSPRRSFPRRCWCGRERDPHETDPGRTGGRRRRLKPSVHPSMSVCVRVCAHVCRDGVSVAAQPPFEPPTAIHEQVNDGSQESGDPHQQHHDDDPRLDLFWRRQKKNLDRLDWPVSSRRQGREFLPDSGTSWQETQLRGPTGRL